MHTETYDLPTFWASALINSDYTGLDDADEAALDGWMTDTFGVFGVIAHCVDADLDNAGFTRWHDASLYVLATEACKFTFHLEQL